MRMKCSIHPCSALMGCFSVSRPRVEVCRCALPALVASERSSFPSRYASTCQTVGMNTGYFTSFTVFLALNDAPFCNKYLRAQDLPEGILPLASYLRCAKEAVQLRAWLYGSMCVPHAVPAWEAYRLWAFTSGRHIGPWRPLWWCMAGFVLREDAATA